MSKESFSAILANLIELLNERGYRWAGRLLKKQAIMEVAFFDLHLSSQRIPSSHESYLPGELSRDFRMDHLGRSSADAGSIEATTITAARNIATRVFRLPQP
jgi:hypothetical protein